MKIGIVYFSGTGTTAFFATEMVTGFREAGHEVHLFRTTQLDPKAVADYDLLGFGAPTYSYRVVRSFSAYLQRVPVMQKPYFLFCTCGGQPGNTLWNMYCDLKTRGWIFLDGIVGRGVNNIRSWRRKRGQTPEADMLKPEDMARARDRAQVILALYEKVIDHHQPPPKPPKKHRLLIPVGWCFTYPWMMRQVEGFKYVDAALCTRCGLCATKICPSGSITFAPGNLPVIKNNTCIGCSGCVNLCPQLAIYTKSSLPKQPYTKYSKFILSPPK